MTARKHPQPRHHHYRGWKSTKLHLSLITMFILIVSFAAVIWLDRANAAAAFGQFTMGLLGAAGIYSAASSAEKFTNPPPPDEPAGPL